MTASYRGNPAARLGDAVYFFALTLIVTPIVDVGAQVWPPHFILPEWRYGTVGLSANYMPTVVMGLVIAGVNAYWMEHRIAKQILAWLSVLLGLVVVAGVISFSLDVVQVREQVNVQAVEMFWTGAVKAGFKLLMCAMTLALLAFGLKRSVIKVEELTESQSAPTDIDWRSRRSTS